MGRYRGLSKAYHHTQEPIIKQSALIAVDEILKFQDVLLDIFPSDGYDPEYWQQVKEEIEKL